VKIAQTKRQCTIGRYKIHRKTYSAQFHTLQQQVPHKTTPHAHSPGGSTFLQQIASWLGTVDNHGKQDFRQMQ